LGEAFSEQFNHEAILEKVPSPPAVLHKEKKNKAAASMETCKES